MIFTVPNKCIIELLEPRQLLSVGAFVNDQDIGAPALPGSASYAGGTYSVNGGGADIGGLSDQFHFTSNPLSGDGSIVADVTTLSNTDASAKAGVMMRSGTSASAAFAGIFVTPSNGIAFAVRTSDGG